MRTAQDVANELNISRSEVYNLLRKKRFSPLVEKKGGQVSVSNKLFKLLKEEVEYKEKLKLENNSNNNTLEVENIEDNSNTEPIEDTKEIIQNENIINPITLLEKQLNLKDNQIAILNNVISNNLKTIAELENKNLDYKRLSEELETLKSVVTDLTKRKNKKRILGMF